MRPPCARPLRAASFRNETSGTNTAVCTVNGAAAVAAVSVVVRVGALVGWDGCEVRLCDPCARVRPCLSTHLSHECPGSPRSPVSFDICCACVQQSKAACMRCTICVGTLPNLGCLRHLRHLRHLTGIFSFKGFLPVFFRSSACVSSRRLKILTMLDHWGAQVAGARCNCTCLRHSLAPRARAPC